MKLCLIWIQLKISSFKENERFELMKLLWEVFNWDMDLFVITNFLEAFSLVSPILVIIPDFPLLWII